MTTDCLLHCSVDGGRPAPEGIRAVMGQTATLRVHEIHERSPDQRQEEDGDVGSVRLDHGRPRKDAEPPHETGGESEGTGNAAASLGRPGTTFSSQQPSAFFHGVR